MHELEKSVTRLVAPPAVDLWDLELEGGKAKAIGERWLKWVRSSVQEIRSAITVFVPSM